MKRMEEDMATNYTRLLQFYKQFGKYYDRQFAAFSARTGLSMREIHVLLFLANNPDYDTSRSKYNFHIVKPEGRYYHFIQSKVEHQRDAVHSDDELHRHAAGLLLHHRVGGS